MLATIEALHGNDKYYYIDYIPHNPKSPEYLELEEYYENSYLPSFADKISRILLQVRWEYPCRVCIGKMEKRIEKYTSIQPFTDVRHYKPEQLADIIKMVIVKDFSVLSILFSNEKSLFSIRGYFQVELYNPTDDIVAFVKLLCQSEGLFLKYKAEDGTRILV